MDKTIQIDTFSRFTQVSRETITSLKKYEDILIEANKTLNLIGNSTIKDIWTRHFLDSVQVIDFIDKNDNLCIDIGSGSGLPGIVLAIIMKHQKSNMKFHLYEKSYHKSNFLKEVSKKFDLNTKIIQKDVFLEKNLVTDVIVARAFKPLPIILELVNSNFTKFKSIILFLGKNGKEMLNDVLSKWQFKYKEKKSLTSEDSSLIKISNLKKK